MTEHANCQPEAWSAAARVARELREEVERLRAIVDAALTLHPAVANTELESAQDITTGRWIQPDQICGTCHVFNGPYDPCSRYMWPSSLVLHPVVL